MALKTKRKNAAPEFENFRDPLAKARVKSRGAGDSGSYRAFLEGKVPLASADGIAIDESEISTVLKPHQRKIVHWCVAGGQRAIFASFGLGKSIMQLEIMRLIHAHKGGKHLIVLPLGVRQEFVRDAQLLNMKLTFIRRPEEMTDDQPFYLTNYESIRDGKLDPSLFLSASLDEASILRGFGTLTYQTFLPLFANVKYRFVATATPSPNRLKELIHYAAFLGIMDSGQALTRFFQRDSTKSNNLTLYPHKQDEFWLWVHSWAIFVQRPSDLGCPDDGYDLPELKIIYYEVPTDHAHAGYDSLGQGFLIKDAALGLRDASREKRDSMPARIAKMHDIISAAPDDHFLLWHHLEDERRAIEKAVPSSLAVFGSLDLETREQRVIDFSDGKFQYLSSKPELSGSGCNFQRHCHKAIFLGIDYSFNDLIQSIHRIYRFLQTHTCEIHIIYSEAEREVLRAVKIKWQQHDEMVQKMTEIIRKYGLNVIDMADVLKRSIGVERVEMKGSRYVIANNDAVEEAKLMADNSVDLMITSIPFSNHYEYTASYNDFGHTDNNDHFWAQMDFLTREVFRVMKPGRLACVHVKDRILFGNSTGAGVPTVSPLHAETIFHGRKHGFDFIGMITVVTDVVRENNQTYRLGWSENAKDGTKMGVGSPEYIVLLRKPQTDRTRGYADMPVMKSKADYTRAQWQVDAHAFWRSSGDRMPTPDDLAAMPPDRLATMFTEMSLQRVYDYEAHVSIGTALEARGALPATFMAIAPGSHHPDVWHDVNRMKTLNSEQNRRNVELHVCPLQLDIVERLIDRYSNKDELVYDPFGGLMTVPYCAIRKGRRGRASELNAQYFADGAHYCRAAEMQFGVPTLFDLMSVA